MCLPKNKVKARHHYKVQGSGLIILQFAALVTHDLAVHAEHVRSKRGARGANFFMRAECPSRLP